MNVASPLDIATRLADQIDTIRVVVISDIHATASAANTTNVTLDATDPTIDALLGARELLREDVQTADYLVCPGDLVHEGDLAPVGWVWKHLEDAAHDLGATLVGAVGNHDLKRDPVDGHAPFDALRELRPRFPLDDLDQFRCYWASDFGAVSSNSSRIVTMNSCALHGGYDPDETKFGRMREGSLEELSSWLEQAPSPAVNICVIHHHPMEWTHKGDLQATHLLRGDLLIALLSRRPEPWMLVHGHKHHPDLGYLGTSTNGPVWLAAGSLGADVLGDSGTSVRNQLHVIDIASDPVADLGLRFAGEIHSFDWEPGRGWTTARHDSGLPRRSGFGYRREATNLVDELRTYLQTSTRRTLSWQEIVDWNPRWHFLTPADRAAFAKAVRAAGGGVTSEHDDRTLEVTMP